MIIVLKKSLKWLPIVGWASNSRSGREISNDTLFRV